MVDNLDFQFESITHYVLPDGRVWEIETGQFVATLPDKANPEYVQDKDGKTALEVVIEALKFYGHPLGELTPTEDLALKIRTERNQKLAETDYLLMPDYPLSTAAKDKAAIYRQALRDITKQEGFPWDGNAPWPVFPL